MLKYRVKRVVKEYTLCGGGCDVEWEVQKHLFWRIYYTVASYGNEKSARYHLEALYNDCRY